ncbi:MAG: hypothetical protein KC464_33625, partial [Myxococcales bacterium]|nr:hypothetical protein [Myxococcales bacterium]
AFYRAYPGVTQAQVVNDAAVHDGIRAFLDAHRDELIGLAPVEVHARIRAHLRELARHRGLDITPQGDGEAAIALRKVGVYVAVAVALVLALALLPVTAPLFAWAYVTMRRKEQTDVPARYPHPVRDLDGLRADEDHVIQNQLTHVVDVKPGRFRLGLLRVVLFAIDVLARVWFVRGDLGGIVTIHFARWVVLPDRRPGIATPRHRLLFFSNYDGSWEAYLGEFIDRASGGLTAVWSNTDGFPRTTKLKEQGADDEETFKNWTRDHQIPTQVWWSGVPTATVQNVRNDVWIRRRLDRPMTEPELDQWLSQL